MAGSVSRWSRVAFLSTLATSAVLIFAPIYATASCESVAGGEEICTTGRQSLIEHGGLGAVAVVSLPVLLAAAPIVVPRRAVAISAAVALSALTVLGAASVGLFFAPAAVLAWLAVPRSGAD